MTQEFARIAKENPGATVGISTHGAVLATLLDGLNPRSKGVYLPPHYNGKEIKNGEIVVLPAAAHVKNAGLLYFIYDSRNSGHLGIYDPAKDASIKTRLAPCITLEQSRT